MHRSLFKETGMGRIQVKLPLIKRMILVVLSCIPLSGYGQQSALINLAPIDGMPISPDNVLGYQIQSSTQVKAQVRGTIRYRNSPMTISYTFPFTLKQGLNTINRDEVHPQWQFSSSALQELFFDYKVLPEGIFEYCVKVVPDNPVVEPGGGLSEECLYYRSNDIFLINLIYPENKAKLREPNPMLTWIANYSFSSELIYRLRVAEMKDNQNPQNAVFRNPAMLDERDLMQNSIVYPVYAKPLEVNKWYAWSVDAYYKGILLGSAETWQFIIPDTVAKPKQVNMSYVDVKREQGGTSLTAIGRIKLKYVLEESRYDVLSLELTNAEKNKYNMAVPVLEAHYGDNRYELDLQNSGLKDKAEYVLDISTKTHHHYKLRFQYLNPEYLR